MNVPTVCVHAPQLAAPIASKRVMSLADSACTADGNCKHHRGPVRCCPPLTAETVLAKQTDTMHRRNVGLCAAILLSLKVRAKLTKAAVGTGTVRL
jgi:hypothetical protein